MYTDGSVNTRSDVTDVVDVLTTPLVVEVSFFKETAFYNLGSCILIPKSEAPECPLNAFLSRLLHFQSQGTLQKYLCTPQVLGHSGT